MKRSKFISLVLAGLLAMGCVFALTGCSGSSKSSSDGKEAVISLAVGDGDTWKSAADPADAVSVSDPVKAGSDKVEFTIKPLKDGTVEVTFTNMKGDTETGSTETFTYEVKDGKLTETGHSAHVVSSL